MNSFFETSKKKYKKRQLGRFLWTLRAFFNLALILSVIAVALVAGLYASVVDEHKDRLDGRYPELV